MTTSTLSLAEICNAGPDHKHRLAILDLEMDEEAGHIRVKGVASHESGAEKEIAFSLQATDALFAGAGLNGPEEILADKEAAAKLLLDDLLFYNDGHYRTRFDIAEQSVAVWFNGRGESNQNPCWV